MICRMTCRTICRSICRTICRTICRIRAPLATPLRLYILAIRRGSCDPLYSGLATHVYALRRELRPSIFSISGLATHVYALRWELRPHYAGSCDPVYPVYAGLAIHVYVLRRELRPIVFWTGDPHIYIILLTFVFDLFYTFLSIDLALHCCYCDCHSLWLPHGFLSVFVYWVFIRQLLPRRSCVLYGDCLDACSNLARRCCWTHHEPMPSPALLSML